ncbi:MAG: CotH kinase family protein [Clostridia bacterium]|nr:CotH kinase family protein [Clostridia bacterium]
MICQRCGTEFNNRDGICPRCDYGRPKPKKNLPKWLGWVIALGSVALVACVGLVLYLSVYFDSDWMHGSWEGSSLAISFNTEEETFILSNGENVISGTFTANKDTFGLMAEDGSIYTYRYERVNATKMKLMFSQNNETMKITVTKEDDAWDEVANPDEGTKDPENAGSETNEPSDSGSETDTQKPITDSKPNQVPDTTTPNNGNNTTTQKPSTNTGTSTGNGSTGTNTSTTVLDESKLELPRLYISTENGAEIQSRDTYLNATVSMSGAGKHDLGATLAGIRGRGNSTWLHFDKKPYRLKFNKKVDLLGMGANKDWVLLANAFDETMMRYYLAFSLAHELELEYTSEFQFVNLFLNGEYRGVYLVCEQIEEGESRVDVNTSKTGEVDTGYLIECIGNSTKEEEERYFLAEKVNGNRLYPTAKEFRFYIKSPEPEECTDAQYEFIKNYITEVNEAIFEKDWNRIRQLVDVETAAKMFVLDEVMLNNDMGYCFYLYKKKGEKLCFGPMWDYDQSCGGSSWGGPTYEGWETGTTHEWYMALMEIPEFESLVKKTYNSHKKFIRNMPKLVDETIKEYQYDFDMNNELWEDLFGDPKKWRRMKELIALKTYDEHVDYLKTWLNNRIEWMEDELGI